MGRGSARKELMREPVAWVFNLDAEDELARGGPHTPTNAVQARVTSLLPLLAPLMKPGDEVLWPGESSSLRASTGRAWCPTPWACMQMTRAGLSVPPAPPAQVLRKVNHRAFAHDLGQALPAARIVGSQSELLQALGDSRALAEVSIERNWLLKRPLGYAGRGRRKVASATLSEPDRVWIEAALRSRDGLSVEPFVERVLDCALHGFLESDGALTLGRPTVQTVDPSGTWQATKFAAPGDLSPLEVELLTQAAASTAKALSKAGYFGPFGLDAFRWRAPDGTLHFQPRCEVNARYSMGWAIGMGDS